MPNGEYGCLTLTQGLRRVPELSVLAGAGTALVILSILASVLAETYGGYLSGVAFLLCLLGVLCVGNALGLSYKHARIVSVAVHDDHICINKSGRVITYALPADVAMINIKSKGDVIIHFHSSCAKTIIWSKWLIDWNSFALWLDDRVPIVVKDRDGRMRRSRISEINSSWFTAVMLLRSLDLSEIRAALNKGTLGERIQTAAFLLVVSPHLGDWVSAYETLVDCGKDLSDPSWASRERRALLPVIAKELDRVLPSKKSSEVEFDDRIKEWRPLPVEVIDVKISAEKQGYEGRPWSELL